MVLSFLLDFIFMKKMYNVEWKKQNGYVDKGNYFILFSKNIPNRSKL